MAEVVNLRQVRKQRDRAEREKKAESNRVLHGESKASRLARKATAERAKALLDGSKREHD